MSASKENHRSLKKKTEREFTCLVIQMARLGDTIQSLMALRAAKQLYPNLRIEMVVRERFSHAVKRVSWIDKVHVFPTKTFIGPILNEKASERSVVPHLARWIRPLLDSRWDFVVNWTYSNSSSYLAALIPAVAKVGYSRHGDLTLSSEDDWSTYVQAVVQGDMTQNIHLTDVLTTQLLTALQVHCGDPVDSSGRPVFSKKFFDLSSTQEDLDFDLNHPTQKLIAIQLGAGSQAKKWDAPRWRKLIEYVLKDHPEYRVILLGGKDDQSASSEIFEVFEKDGVSTDRLHDRVGKTDFDQWTNIIAHSQWLFSTDTSAIHLASLLGTRVLNLSIGPVKWEETGPYGNGHYVIAPRLEHQPLSSQAVYTTWTFAAKGMLYHGHERLEKHFQDLIEFNQWDDFSEDVRVYRTRIRPTQEGGGVVYESMLDQPQELKEWVSIVMGYIARAWFCGWVPEIGQGLERSQFTPDLIRQLRGFEESTALLAKICRKSIAVSQQISQLAKGLGSSQLMSVDQREEFQRLGKKLRDLDHLLERTANTHIHLRVFSQIQRVMMHNLSGTEIKTLGDESVLAYQRVLDGVTIFQDWLKYSFSLAKPVAIEPQGKVIPLQS